jgi:ribonuclease HI
MKDKIIIFTDGSSRGNPGAGGWAAITVRDNKVKEIGGGEPNVTNNQMELTAAINGLANLGALAAPIEFYTDSSYVVNGITEWVSSWRVNNWRTKTKKEVLNRELWEKLIELSENKNIEWKYIGGHVGVAANERADEIATMYADRLKPALYNGPISKYSIDVLNFKIDNKMAALRRREGRPAYSYVSSVNGKIKIHKTWADCEKGVKGKSGARFKKALDASDEAKIIKEFSKIS